MNLYSVQQMRAWDAYTITHEPVDPIDLMERAGIACGEWIIAHKGVTSYLVLCGTGNNGGDGLVIARYLADAGCATEIWIIGDARSGSESFCTNLDRLKSRDGISIREIHIGADLPQFHHEAVLIDALFGSGLHHTPEGWYAEVIGAVNRSGLNVVSIDLPSGFFADSLERQDHAVVQATDTLVFQQPRRAFLFAENEHLVGHFHVLDIGLHPAYPQAHPTTDFLFTAEEAQRLIPVRSLFIHKRKAGQVQVVAGSHGMMGAAILASRAALRTGCGLVTACPPAEGYLILQSNLPEALCLPDTHGQYITEIPSVTSADAVVIGPGIGKQPETSLALRKFLSEEHPPLVIDADALNIIASRSMLDKIPRGSILTPHVGEFDRLFGPHDTSMDRYTTARKKAEEYQIHIVLKGAYTLTATSTGLAWFNTSGNSAMATAGSGDVLSGIIGSLLAQGLPPESAAPLGVFLHGLAGDIAASRIGSRGLLAGDIAEAIPAAIDVCLR